MTIPRKDPIADLEKALADGFVHDPGEGDDSDGAHARRCRQPSCRPTASSPMCRTTTRSATAPTASGLPSASGPTELDFMHFVKFLAPQIPLCFMGDEGNLQSGFPSSSISPRMPRKAQAGRPLQADARNVQASPMSRTATFPIQTIRRHSCRQSCPGRTTSKWRSARAALDRFRGPGRNGDGSKLWPLSATPCLDARTARQGNCLIVTWQFEAGSLSMALNPTSASADLACLVSSDPVFSGQYSFHGDVLRLGPWSAVAWSS